MLKIRLQRIGRTNDPSYRVVVTEHTNGPKAGKAVDTVGSYNPKSKARVLDGERIKYWLSKGAKASGTMHNMLISAGIITGKKVNVLPKKTVPTKASPEGDARPTPEESRKKEEEATAPAPKAEAKEETPSAPVEEANADEVPAEASAQA